MQIGRVRRNLGKYDTEQQGGDMEIIIETERERTVRQMETKKARARWKWTEREREEN